MKNIIFLIGVFSSSMALALPSQELWVPQTTTLQPKEFKFDLQTQFTPKKDSSIDNTNASRWGLTFGLFELWRLSMEAGFDWVEPSPKSVNSAIATNIRMAFNRVEDDGWAAAIGAKDFGFDAGSNDYNILYALFQNKLGQYWQMALGGYNGNVGTLGANGGDASGDIFGLWNSIQKGRGSWGIEMQTGRNYFGYIFAGLNLEVRDGVRFYAGYGVPNDRLRFKDWVLMRTSIEF